MKKVGFTLNLLFIVLISFAQSNHNEEQVKKRIQDGRNLIVKQITEGNHSEAISTLNDLKNAVGENYIVLYPREELMVALATRNFRYFADSARNYDPLQSIKRKGFVFNDFRNELYLYMLPEIMNISNQLENSDLPEMDKEVVRIYINYLFSDDISALNKLIRKFEREHSNSLFNNFLNSLKRLTLNSRLNFSIGYGGECIGEKLEEDYFDILKMTKIELDGFIRKNYFSLYVGGGFTDLETSYLLNNNDEITRVNEDKVSSLKFGMKFGRIIYSSKEVKIYPYLSAGGYEISPSSVLYGNDYMVSTNGIKTDGFFAGVGISSDVILKKWKAKQMYDPEGYFFIRPNLGYDYLLSPGDIIKNNNFYFSLSLGVSIGPKK